MQMATATKTMASNIRNWYIKLIDCGSGDGDILGMICVANSLSELRDTDFK